MHFVYPRLPFFAAERLVEEAAATYRSAGLAGLEELVAFEHSRAEPVATGGRVADVHQVERVRLAVVDAAKPWRERGSISRADSASFDLAVGRALHDTLQIIPSDAAHDETWNFLTLVAMPDIAVLRFPDMHLDRMFGTLRNPLRSSWVRRDTLGDLTDRYPRPLGVDEMVGLFERSEMARNRPLIRALAKAVMEYGGAGSRSDWARDVFKEIRYITGPRALDGMSESEIATLIRHAERVPAADSAAQSIAIAATQSADRAQMPSERALDARFQDAMRDLYERARRELGYNATYLVRMMEKQGGIATAKRLVLSDHASDGFTYLWERQRLDLSVEALVLMADFSTLFDDQVLESARRRLSFHGWR